MHPVYVYIYVCVCEEVREASIKPHAHVFSSVKHEIMENGVVEGLEMTGLMVFFQANVHTQYLHDDNKCADSCTIWRTHH